MAYSLASDGDFDIQNNYRRDDYARMGIYATDRKQLNHGGEPGAHATPGHSVLVSIVGAPVAIWGGIRALRMVSLLLFLISGPLLFLSFERLFPGRRENWIALALYQWASPALFMSGLFFSEMISCCLLALSVLLLVRRDADAWFALALGMLVPSHPRMALMSITLGAAFLADRAFVYPIRSRAYGLRVLAVGSAVAITVAWQLWQFGKLTGGTTANPLEFSGIQHLVRQMLQTNLGHRNGWTAYFPVWILGVLGLLAGLGNFWGRRDEPGKDGSRKKAEDLPFSVAVGSAAFLLCFLVYSIALILGDNGNAPVARLWAPFSPLFAVGLCVFLNRFSRHRWAIWILAGSTGVWSLWSSFRFMLDPLKFWTG